MHPGDASVAESSLMCLPGGARSPAPVIGGDDSVIRAAGTQVTPDTLIGTYKGQVAP